MPSADMPSRVASALGSVGVDLPAKTPTSALSGGQTQRLALAGGLALEPTVLLLDEPTAMLDRENAASVRDAVNAAVASRGLTLVVVEHVLGPWVDLVDRLVVLDERGRVVADGLVRKILDDHHDLLLGMGVWVPGSPAPAPLEFPDIFGPPSPAGAMTPAAIRATALTVTRRTRTVDGLVRERVAARVDGSMAPAPGEFTAVVGPSGSGKSTVLQALAGFLRPASGEVRTGQGKDPADLDPVDLASAIAWIPQWASSTVIARSVLDEVLVTSRTIDHTDRAGAASSETRARTMLDALNLGHLLEADPRHLSGGELRRLAVASAVLHQPDVVLADEPTIGQDRHTWAAVVGLLAAYRRAGGAIVAATHDAHVIARADEVHTLTAQPRPSEDGARRPWLAGRAPLALLGDAALAVPAGVLSPGWQFSLLLIGVELLLGVMGMVSRSTGVIAPVRAFALRLVPGIIASLSVAWSTWLLGGHRVDLAADGLTRILVIVIPSAVLLVFIDTDRLGDQLAQRLHLPDRPVVAVSAALHRMQSFAEIWAEISRARRVRGLGTSWRRPTSIVTQVTALTVGLLVRSLRAAADLAVAMDARGFATAQHRTWWEPGRFRPADAVLVLLAAVPLILTCVVLFAG